MDEKEVSSYSEINDRLKEIIAQVSDESIPLDNALDLFEEAVKLGVQASSLLEEDVVARNAATDESARTEGDAASQPTAADGASAAVSAL